MIETTITKICTRCDIEKVLDSFSRHKNGKYGRCSICKECRKIELKDYNKEYYYKNQERLLEQKKQHRLDNVDKYKEKDKLYYNKNKDDPEFKQNRREYRLENQDRIKEIGRVWREVNKPKRRAAEQKREADKRNATPRWADRWFIDEIYELSYLRSRLTGVQWHVDHIVPLKSDLVCGLHCEQNLRVITAFENISKKNRYWPDMPT